MSKPIVRVLLCLFGSFGSAWALDTEAVFPEEHFERLRSYLGIAANRVLGIEAIEEERRAWIDAGNAADRTQVSGLVYGAGILENREDGEFDERARVTWELNGERTLFRFSDGMEARRALGALEGSRVTLDARVDSAAWLLRVRVLYFELIAADAMADSFERALPVLRDQVETLEALGDSGRIAALDVEEAALWLYQIEGESRNADQRRRLLHADLSGFIGMNDIPEAGDAEKIRFRKVDRLTEVKATEKNTIMSRPADLERVESEIDGANAMAQIEESERWPRVVARSRVYQDELQGPRFDGTITRTNAEIMLGVEWKIWDSGRSASRARAHRLRAERLASTRARHLAAHHRHIRALEAELEGRVFDFEMAQRSLALQKRHLSAATEAARLDPQVLMEELGYQLDVLKTELDLARTISAYWHTRSRLVQKAMGEPFLQF